MAGLNRKERFNEIQALKSELENSPYNTATQTQEALDYYDTLFLEEAKARRAAEFGMTDAERAVANQGFSEASNLASANALNAGGGSLQKYINANLNNNANKFQVDLAAQNDAVKRQNKQIAMNYLNMLGNAAQQSQNIQNMNFQKQILAEQAIGEAEKNWYETKDARNTELLKAGVSIAGAGAAIASDIRLKENIVYSHQENGYKIYEFNYKDNPKERFSGVMAQEVQKLNPSAVVEENGYLKVNYDKLGITMKKVN